MIEDVQTCFNEFEWVSSVPVESWVEASSCSCERVFSYVMATDLGPWGGRPGPVLVCDTPSPPLPPPVLKDSGAVSHA